MRPNVLFLTPRLPFPLVGGDRVKAFHLLKLLAREYRVTCVSFVEGPPAPPEWLSAIRDLGVELHPVPLSPLRSVARVAATIFSSLPLEVQYYRDQQFRETVTTLAARQSFDLVISFFMRTAQYAPLVNGVPRILVAEDARVMLQERATAHASLTPGYLMRAVERRKLLRYEPEILNAFDLTTYVAEADRNRIAQLNPRARTAIVTNGVDVEEFSFHDDQPSRSGMVFAGKMDVMHNVRMAQRIGREIFPLVRRAVPGVTCTIIGATPAPSVKKLAGRGVEVTGSVVHTRDRVSQGAVFIHPQRIGAGIQNKVLEAMALGTPVVTTPVGISGIAATSGTHVLIGTSTEELAGACTQLLQSTELRTRLARNARRLIEEQHTWEVVGRQLDAAISSVLCGRHASPISSAPMEAAV